MTDSINLGSNNCILKTSKKVNWSKKEEKMYFVTISYYIRLEEEKRRKTSIKRIAELISTKTAKQISSKWNKMKKKYPSRYSKNKTKSIQTDNTLGVINEFKQKTIFNEEEYIVFKDTLRNKEIKIEKTLLEDLNQLSEQGPNGESIKLTEKVFKFILQKKSWNTIYQKIISNDKDK